MRPGSDETRASVLRPVSAFSSEDLPTFDRPAKAISGPAERRQLIQLLRAEEELALGGEQHAAGFQRRLVVAWLGCRRPGHGGQVRARLGFASLVRRMISHCCPIDSVLFQLQ